MIFGEDQPAEFAREGVCWNCGHVIIFECNHFEGATLCQLIWENSEIAIRKEGDL